MVKPGHVDDFEIIGDDRAGEMLWTAQAVEQLCSDQPWIWELKDLEKWQNNLLPSRQFGFIILTASTGIMFITNKQVENTQEGKSLDHL